MSDHPLSASTSVPHAVLGIAERLVADGRFAEAEAALALILQNFPGDIGVLRLQARAAADPETRIARTQALAASRPHDRALQLDLAFALMEVNGGSSRGERSMPDLPGLIRLATSHSAVPDRARILWALARDLHPMEVGVHLSLAETLRGLSLMSERDDVLAEAQRLFPRHVDIATVWVQSAGLVGRWGEAIERVRVLDALEPDTLMAALVLGNALGRTGNPQAALPVVTAARVRFPHSYWLGHLEVETLLQLNRASDAFDVALALHAGFRAEVQVEGLLRRTLSAVAEHADAALVIRRAASRLPGEMWIATELARMAAERGDWREAVALLRQTGLPDAGTASQQRDFADALIRSGDDAAAAAVLQRLSQEGAAPDRRRARITLAELRLAQHRAEDAVALWQGLAGEEGPIEPAFAALTAALAAHLDPAAAAPLLLFMLTETAQDDAAWQPALAAAATNSTLCSRLARLLGHVPATSKLLGLIAHNLCGPMPDADEIARRIAHAVVDGRPQIAALLLGSAPHRPRAAQERVGLRLFINQHFGTPEDAARLPPRNLLVLLGLARCFDPESLFYLAELVRARLPAAEMPELPDAAAVCGRLAHTSWPTPQQAAPTRPLRLALCLHGTPDRSIDRAAVIAAIGGEAHDVTIVAHLWRGAAAAEGDDVDPIDRLPDGLQEAVLNAGLDADMAAAGALYPNLFGRQESGRLDPATLKQVLATAHIVVEDADAAAFRGKSQAWRTGYKRLQAHRLAVRVAPDVDLFVHLRCGSGLVLDNPDWFAISSACLAPLVCAELGYHMRTDEGLSVGSDLMIGARVPMDIASDSFALAEMILSGRAHVHGFPTDHRPHGAIAAMVALSGITALRVPTRVHQRPAQRWSLSPAEALSLLWKDLRRRPPATHDSALLKAATAEVTGGLAF